MYICSLENIKYALSKRKIGEIMSIDGIIANGTIRIQRNVSNAVSNAAGVEKNGTGIGCYANDAGIEKNGTGIDGNWRDISYEGMVSAPDVLAGIEKNGTGIDGNHGLISYNGMVSKPQGMVSWPVNGFVPKNASAVLAGKEYRPN